MEGIMSESFTLQSMIRGYHVCKEVWDPVSVGSSNASHSRPSNPITTESGPGQTEYHLCTGIVCVGPLC